MQVVQGHREAIGKNSSSGDHSGSSSASGFFPAPYGSSTLTVAGSPTPAPQQGREVSAGFLPGSAKGWRSGHRDSGPCLWLIGQEIEKRVEPFSSGPQPPRL